MWFAENVAAYMASHAADLTKWAMAEVNEIDDLAFTTINRRNPVDMVFTCIEAALVAAVVLSGGKIKFGDMLHVELPPLGKGIAELKKALRSGNAPRLNQTKSNDDGDPAP